MFYFLANSCYKENCYFKMYLVLLLVKCEEDKNRFQKGVEKDLIALSEESIPVNTKQKAMWAYRLYEKWAQWRKDAYDPRVDFSTVGDLLMIDTNWPVSLIWNYCKSLIALIQQKVSASLNWNMRLLFTE